MTNSGLDITRPNRNWPPMPDHPSNLAGTGRPAAGTRACWFWPCAIELLRTPGSSEGLQRFPAAALGDPLVPTLGNTWVHPLS